MEPKIIPKQETLPSFDPNAVAVKYIEYYDSAKAAYSEAKITPKIISKILKEVSKGINVYLFLDPDGECDWMEVLSDGEWLYLGRFRLYENDREDEYFFSYNPDYASTIAQITESNYSDKNVWTELLSGGQSLIPKVHAVTDMESGVKAVEFFIRTGGSYPGIHWVQESMSFS